MTSLRFLFDGKRINDDETPKQVNFYISLKFLINYCRSKNSLHIYLTLPLRL